MKNCSIYYHFPFDIGCTFDTRLSEFADFLDIALHSYEPRVKPIQIFRYELVEHQRIDAFSLSTPINIKLHISEGEKIQVNDKCEVQVVQSDINIFDSGIGICHLKFLLAFSHDITSETLYEASNDLYSHLAPLEKGEGTTEFSQEIKDAIVNIRNSAAEFFRDKVKESFPRSYSEQIDYIYPLFYLGNAINSEELKEFLCLLYLRPTNDYITKDEINKTFLSNSVVYNNNFFLISWEGSITAGTSTNEQVADSNARIIEIASYVWYSLYVLDSHLSKEIGKLLSTGNSTITLTDSEEQLSVIRNLRVFANGVLESHRNIRVSLWGSVIQIFDKILKEAWVVDRLENAIHEKMDLLTTVYRDTVDSIERQHNMQISKSVFNLQIIGFALASAIAIFPFIAEDTRNSILNSPPDVATILPLVVAIIIISVTIGIGHTVSRYRWRKRVQKTKYE